MPDFVKWTGKSPEHILDVWLQSDTVRALEKGHITFAEFHAAFIKEWDIDITHDALAEAFEGWVKTAYPGALQLLAELKPQHTLACLTNTNCVQWPIIQKTLHTDKYFDHQFVSYHIGKVKPDRDIFEHVAVQLDVPPKNILFIDDSQTNVQAARECGIIAHTANTIDAVCRVLRASGVALSH